MNRALRTAAIAWLITAVYYFYQYTLRSAPAVMTEERHARDEDGVHEPAVDPLRDDRGTPLHPHHSLRHGVGCPLPRGRARFDYGTAVIRSSMVPFGWIMGCPLLGLISDRIGRRKPVIIAGAVTLFVCPGWILYGNADLFPPYVLGLVTGIASGAAMLPYTVIKEANPPHMSGTSTGVVNFINFTFSALLGPVFGSLLVSVSGGAPDMTLAHYQTAFQWLLYGVLLAIVLTLLLKETGPAAGRARIPAAVGEAT